MRSTTEVKLLKIKQKLLDALNETKGKKLINFSTYSKLRLELEVCNELLIEARKKAIKEALATKRGKKCEM